MTEDLFSRLPLETEEEKPVAKTPPRKASKPKTKEANDYNADAIEVLEGLEPVRKRPGMYIGGTDEHALHHLASEVFDNSMDEAVAGYATRIEIDMQADGTVTIRDNGRGIPIDPHPKFPKKSALEVILTTLHSGGKFGGKAYETSGGLHGVGISVVNALSDKLVVEVVRDKAIWRQEYSRGEPVSKLTKEGAVANRRGTSISFHADPEIFGARTMFKATRLYALAKSKAYLFKGVEIRWSCDPSLLSVKGDVPEQDVIHFPNGLSDYLQATLGSNPTVTPEPFVGEVELPDNEGRVEWSIHWPLIPDDSFVHSFCNTIPTPIGGTHEFGLKAALNKGMREYGQMVNNKKVSQVTGDDVMGNASVILSLFIRDPQFQGQTKDKLVSNEANKLVENAVRDHFDHWLSQNPEASNALLAFVIEKAEERLKRKKQKEVSRKSVTQKLRLPGKLTDCTKEDAEGTEIFLVEGDSAGGSAKQARSRETQAILPLRGKILNVASAASDKIKANQELNDLVLALGCGSGSLYDEEKLRYEKVIIMTDADVDGAHISTLLMTFFFCEMPELILGGHLYLAKPPLFRITQGSKVFYASDDKEKDTILKSLSGNKKIDVGRFKGLGEMTPPQLKETTMDPDKRILLKVGIADEEQGSVEQKVDHLMGKNPECRFRFIQEQTALRGEDLTEGLDV